LPAWIESIAGYLVPLYSRIMSLVWPVHRWEMWVGIGAVLTAVIGIVAFKDPVNVLTIGSIVLIIGGVVGLQLAGAGH